MKFAITLLIAAVIVVAGAWFLVTTNDPVPTEPQPPATTTPNGTNGEQPDDNADTGAIPADWPEYESEVQAGYTFSFRHPSVAEVTQVQPTIYELKYTGPEAEPNTEITDGYYLSFVFQADATLETYEGREDATGEVERMTWNGYPAISYETTSVLTGDPVEHIVIAPIGVDSPVLDITVSVYGDEAGSYQATVNDILNTLRLEEGQTGGNGSGDTADLIRIDEPASGETVASPVSLSGEARGNWYFEATAPVVIVDWDGRIIGEGFIEADGDWMTEDFVPFSGSVTYEQEPQPYSASGTVIFQKANPSGLPENDAAVEVPVVLE